MRLLFCGDSPTCTTGFATITKNICRELDALGWEIHILGVNYNGDPHNQPWPIYPAGTRGDQNGINRLNDIVHRVQPDILLFNSDWWVVRRVCNTPPPIPTVAYMPVDGCNVDQPSMELLSNLTMAIWYTQFGRNEAEKKGFTGRSAVIPHGIDLDLYKPAPKDDARRRRGFIDLGLRDNFIVGNVNRNTPRKRLDLTIEYFAEWVKEYKRDDARLYLHCLNKDKEPGGIDIGHLSRWFGLQGILMPDDSKMDSFSGIPETEMPDVYNSFDVQITTTMGEGWGLPVADGMACGIPQIVPDWAALGEWPDDAHKVPCTGHYVNLEGVVMGVPDRQAFIEALELAYQGKLAKPDRSKLEKYDWKIIGRQFHEALRRAIASFVPPELTVRETAAMQAEYAAESEDDEELAKESA